MVINFKKINSKFLIIPLSLIVFGGINNSIQAMDNDYDRENTVDTSNNNNIINANKLKEKIKFSDFKYFVRSLYYYERLSQGNKEKIEKQCINIISLLPQFMKNDSNNISFNDRYRKFINDFKDKLTQIKKSKVYENELNNHMIASKVMQIILRADEQFGIKMSYLLRKAENSSNIRSLINGIIKYGFNNYEDEACIKYYSKEICLNYLLDYSCFFRLFDNDIWHVKTSYNAFLQMLNKYYQENFNKDEYTKVLRIMLNNCLMYLFRSHPNFAEIAEMINYKKFDECINYLFYDYKKNPYNTCNDNKCDIICSNILYSIIPYLVCELAKIEYNNCPNVSMPVKTVSDRIMNYSIMPCIKKCVLSLCDSLSLRYKNEILKQNQIILDLEKSENKENQDKVKKAQGIIKKLYNILQNEMPSFTKHLINVLNNEEVIKKFRDKLEINDIVHIATKDLRRKEVFNTFSKKSKMPIKSKYVVENINNFIGNDDILIEMMKNTRPAPREEVNINNESEKK